MESLACPNCRQVDQVRKVSALVAEGTRQTTTIIEHRRSVSVGEAFSTTTLATRLARPSAPNRSGCGMVAGFAAGTVGLIIAAVFGCILGLAVSGSLRPGGAWIFVLPLAGAIILPALLFVVGRFVTDRFGHGPSQADLRWLRAHQRWEQLFYCGRCDGVFIPGDIGLVPTPQMQEYLAGQ